MALTTDRRRPSVLLIGDTLNLGGTEGQFVEIACRLDRSRWNVHVTCLRAEGPLRGRLEAAGVHPWSCGRGSFRLKDYSLALWGLVKYLKDYGICLVHCFDFYSNVLGVPAARLAGVPIIASQRDLGNLRSQMQQTIHDLILRRAHDILVNSPMVTERLRDNGIASANQITLIPNGVDIDRFSGPPAAQRKAMKKVMIGTLANLRPEKGVRDVVLAARSVRQQHPETQFVIWGEGPCRPKLERLIGQLGLADAVTLKGSTHEPHAALRDFDIFVLASLSESCSNALMEAMATGLPVIATRVGGNPYLIQDGITGLLVPSGDPSALATALVRLIREPRLADNLGIQARAHMHAEFSMEKMVARVEILYERALATLHT